MSSKSPGPQKRKQFCIKLFMLDDSEIPFQIETKTTGQELTNLVYQHLKLIESDYFGLEYLDSKGKKCWLDYDKAVSRQVESNARIIFGVKFYTPDPGQLEEEYTRYLYALQIKRDLAEGLLLCSDATASLLVSYVIQAELGDYLDSYNNSTSYFQNRQFFPHQNEEHEAKILEYHKNHVGQTPAEADLNLLDIARKIELYGIIMHPAKDHEGVQLNLAVAHMGILVFQNFTKINTFSWAKIRKLSFKRKKFLVKLHPENYGFYKDTVEFYFDNRDDSKNFWKKCIEHHSFFRCISTQRMPRQKSKLLTRGSSFRYYGRTQKELIENARENFSKNRSFDRSYHSMRSISHFGGGSGGGGGGANGMNNGQMNGTQSLNRNLATRSTGALMMSNQANESSTFGSNDSNVPHQSSSSTHHLSYVPSGQSQTGSPGHIINKSHTLEKQRSIQDQQITMASSVPSLNHIHHDSIEHHHLHLQHQHQAPNRQLQRQIKHVINDGTSTHGSRTIDSRYSRGRGGSDHDDDQDEDDQDEDEDDEDDDDDDDDEEEENEEEAEGDEDDEDENVNEDEHQDMVNNGLVEKPLQFQNAPNENKCNCGMQHLNSDSEQQQQQQIKQNAKTFQGSNYATNANTRPNIAGVLKQQHQQQSQQASTKSAIIKKLNNNLNDIYANISYNDSSNVNITPTTSFKAQTDHEHQCMRHHAIPATSKPLNNNLVTLPITQQQTINRIIQPQGKRFIDMNNSSTYTTDNESPSILINSNTNPQSSAGANAAATSSLVPSNPNKIYSRKEVITTYKEETKNTHTHEEYLTTTTSSFFDQNNLTPPTSTSKSLVIKQQPTPKSPQQVANLTATSSFKSQPNIKQFNANANANANDALVPLHSVKQPLTSSPASAPLKITSTTTTTTTTLSQLVNMVDELNNNNNNNASGVGGVSSGLALAGKNEDVNNADEQHQNTQNDEEKEEDTSYDDEVSKNDRCTLAANIIYSSLHYNKQSPSTSFNLGSNVNYERVKRPATLTKPILSSSPGPQSSILKTSNSNVNNYNRFKQQPIQRVPLKLQTTVPTTTTTTSSTNNGGCDSDDQFPPPPPIPNTQLPHQHSHLQTSINQPPIHLLHDYQEPKTLRTSNFSNNKSIKPSNNFFNVEDEFKKKKIPMDESYCIVKELVMTERTFKKDLDLLTNSFRQYAIKNNFDLSEFSLLVELLYNQSLDPINDFHTQFLKDLELRLFNWTDKGSVNVQEYHKIGDLLVKLNSILLSYRTFIEKYEDILNEVDQACKKNKKFETLFRDFESQKMCYLPFTMFLLKPIQRLIHYKLLIERLLIYYGLKHYDYQETYSVFGKIENINELINDKLPFIENKQKLIELQRDLIGIDNLITSKSFRYFIREGSLQKLSRKGYQQRMFFLFNDILFYCARSSSPILQFKIHGEYQLKNLQVEDGNPHINIPNSFTIYSANRSILVSAISQDEKSKWLQDLYEAIEKSRGILDDKIIFSTIKSNSSSDNNLDAIGELDLEQNDPSHDTSIDNQAGQNIISTTLYHDQQQQQQQKQQHRANTTMHVCWHRNISVSSIDNHKSIINQLSGYLLRKFKNSNGWQKLWVVYTHFCLFFYKTYQDEFPLASLPLLGYTITQPDESDQINKDFVFKLKFKNHVYFFRAESQYSYDRWLEVIESAAQKNSFLNAND